MEVYSTFVGLFFILNIIFAVVVIFLERRDAASTWAWLMVLFFIPFLGFLMYLLFGQNLSKSKMFQWEDRKKLGIDELLQSQILGLSKRDFDFKNEIIQESRELIYMHLINNDAVLTQDNAVDIFTDGTDKFNSLINDILGARDHIHLQYYILKKDDIGTKLINILTEK